MKRMKFLSCLVAALGIFAFNVNVQAQNALLAANNEAGNAPLDDIVQSSVHQRMPIAYHHVEERDVMWKKRIWREIDVREKRNHHFATTNRSLAKLLIDAAESGKVRAFGTMDDEFKTIMNQQEIKDMLYQTDTIMNYNFVTEAYESTVIEIKTNPSDIQRYRIKEIWYFDTRRGRMDTRILGIAPIVNRYDEDGNFIASMPLCWFYYDDLRPILAHTEAPMEHNDVAYQSWDDVFLSRNFASYVTKRSNLRDLRLQDYLSGTAALLESDKITQEIFHFEHDQWSY